MKVIVFIPLLIGFGIFAAVGLSTLMVVMITAVGEWLATLVAPFGNRERRAAERPVKAGRLARQETM